MEEKIKGQIKFLKSLDTETEIAVFKVPVHYSNQIIDKSIKILQDNYPELRFIIIPDDWQIETLTVEEFREKY